MAQRNLPYLKLYVQDFLSDEKLNECSAEATGVYIRLMCIMHKNEEYGVVRLKPKDKHTGRPVADLARKLARQMPYDTKTIERGLEELLDEDNPNFNVLLDPKCCWALKHLDLFPVEVNRADYMLLLRVPGIGYKSAGRIVKARRMGNLEFEDLKKMGVVLKRALYFITCGGKMMYPVRIEEDYITRNLLNTKERLPEGMDGMTYRQLSLFDDVNFSGVNGI